MANRKRLSLGTVMVLHALARGCKYGFDVMAETGLTSGTIYPALEKLEGLGYAVAEWEDSRIAQNEKRPARRYFEITEQGLLALQQAMQKHRSLAPLAMPGVVEPRMP